ncbi:MAG: sulfide/dihydroorotate dehydrogenase-like FAD/NAD-binding protein [Elusimicrobiales bacterium]
MPEKYEIISRTELSPSVRRHVIYAPLVAAKAKAGQFIILRAAENGERVPITLCDWDAAAGTVTVIIQSAGKSTTLCNSLGTGDKFLTVAGPLGIPAEIKNYGTAVCVGGGVGIAEVYPIARALKAAGNRVVSVLGARSRQLLILESEMRSVSGEVLVATDDGSYGTKGLVTGVLGRLRADGAKMDFIFVIGPVVMMKAVADLTRDWGVETVASLNPIMVDGTGMCGCCRVEVGGEVKFACVDGPHFDAHKVNFQNLAARISLYRDKEKAALESCAGCRLDEAARKSEK